MQSAWRWLPEAGLFAAILFFGLRELATFPAAWEDSGHYTLVAKMLTSGKGYALPILDQRWEYPYFLSVGPTVILPVALAIRIFGFSLEAARLFPVLYLFACTLLYYLYTKAIAGKDTARWSTALLISFSAFVNTGKPVQGSIAAFFFLLLGLLCLHHAKRKTSMALLAGAFFGLAIITKLTFALILPALGIALAHKCFTLRRVSWSILFAFATAILIPLPWFLLELMQQEGFGDFLRIALGRSSNGDVLTALANKIPLLLRFQYQYFLLLAVLTFIGFWKGTLRLRPIERVLLVSLFLLFFAHFALREGWYRHLLPAHLLFLFFVPLGAFHLLGRRWGAALLTIFIIMQGLWQLDHRGSSRSQTAAQAAVYIQEHLSDTDVLIQHPEIFVRLPDNSHWLYYPQGATEELIPERFIRLSNAHRCIPFIRKLNPEDQVLYREQAISVGGSYSFVAVPAGCGE